MVGRLAVDHANAQHLAKGLAQMPGILLEPTSVQTNLVIFELESDTPTVSGIMTELRERGIMIGAIGGRRFRAVTHAGIGEAEIDAALSAFEATLGPPS
jgi:threonine aldolase